MDFKDMVLALSDKVNKLKDTCKTEEATKNALIMPFINALGYDVFNPMEVIPEMDCDLTKKKGDKVDYAISVNGEPTILIECKHWEEDLDFHVGQLKGYFSAAQTAKFGILTNGINYRFYADLVQKNLMDEKPFLEFNIENIKDTQIEALKQFHKSYYDKDSILNTANELKYMSGLKDCIKNEFTQPSVDIVKVLTRRVYDGMLTQKVIDSFTDLVKRAFNSHINDVISEKLNAAIKSTEDVKKEDKQETEDIQASEPNIETTEDELQGFYIVKAILANTVDINRIAQRDTQTYFTILFDDNNRKPICKLHFNNLKKKQIELIDEEKKSTKYSIDKVEDIYNYAQQLIDTVKRYMQA